VWFGPGNTTSASSRGFGGMNFLIGVFLFGIARFSRNSLRISIYKECRILQHFFHSKSL
jgi:hypothetical protein